MKLEGKVAFITGASRGIGLGCARVFARHGARVIMASNAAAEGEEAAKELNAQWPGRVEFLFCDVTEEASLRGALEATVEKFGRLDCLVNNVGWHPPSARIDDISVADFDRLLRLNLTSTFMGCKFATPFLRRSRGSIINMASEVGLIGQADAVSYVATKSGQIGLTKALALDLAPGGVRVNAVCPAGVLTPMMREWASTQYDAASALKIVEAQHPLGRMATADEIGEVCAFLASAEASFITGQAICPDGGAALGYRRG